MKTADPQNFQLTCPNNMLRREMSSFYLGNHLCEWCTLKWGSLYYPLELKGYGSYASLPKLCRNLATLLADEVHRVMVNP